MLGSIGYSVPGEHALLGHGNANGSLAWLGLAVLPLTWLGCVARGKMGMKHGHDH